MCKSLDFSNQINCNMQSEFTIHFKVNIMKRNLKHSQSLELRSNIDGTDLHKVQSLDAVLDFLYKLHFFCCFELCQFYCKVSLLLLGWCLFLFCGLYCIGKKRISDKIKSKYFSASVCSGHSSGQFPSC